MKSGLSKREKTMLYILLCFLIVVGGFFFVISPCLTAHDTAKDKLAEVQMQKAVMQRTIKAYPETAAALKDAQVRFQEKRQPYFSMMTNEELDKELQKITTKFGLEPMGLSMTDTADKTLKEFIVDSANSDKEPKSMTVQMNNVSLQLNGTQTAMFDLLEELSRMSTLRVINLDMSFEKASALQTFTLNLEVYMVK